MVVQKCTNGACKVHVQNGCASCAKGACKLQKEHAEVVAQKECANCANGACRALVQKERAKCFSLAGSRAAMEPAALLPAPWRERDPFSCGGAWFGAGKR